jgi:hypothetical protein
MQLARDEEMKFPAASIVTQRDFCVDDILSGADTLQQTKNIQLELVAMLKSGGLNLHKWCLNSPQLPSQLAGQHQVQLADHQAVKTLGLLWLPKSDYFLISTAKELPQNQPVTKRTVLSSIASLYDPLGLAGPIVVTAKLLMYNLWRKQIEWDQALHEVDHNNWIHFRAKLNELQEIKVVRCRGGLAI